MLGNCVFLTQSHWNSRVTWSEGRRMLRRDSVFSLGKSFSHQHAGFIYLKT